MDAALEEDARANHKKVLGKRLIEAKDKSEIASIVS